MSSGLWILSHINLNSGVIFTQFSLNLFSLDYLLRSALGVEEWKDSMGYMRREFFDAYLFDTLSEVKIMTQEWIYDYNNYRPHSVLGELSPIEYLDKYNLEMHYSV